MARDGQRRMVETDMNVLTSEPRLQSWIIQALTSTNGIGTTSDIYGAIESAHGRELTLADRAGIDPRWKNRIRYARRMMVNDGEITPGTPGVWHLSHAAAAPSHVDYPASGYTPIRQLRIWIAEALQTLGGSASTADFTNEIERTHAGELTATDIGKSADIKWQNRVRQARRKMRDSGILAPTAGGMWSLNGEPAPQQPITTVNVISTLPEQVRHRALYRHYNANGDLLYIGISVDINRRNNEHLAGSSWFAEVSTIGVEHLGCLLQRHAEAIEELAIRKEMPRHNIRHNDNNGVA